MIPFIAFQQVFDGNHRLLAILSLLEDFEKGTFHGCDEEARARLRRVSCVVYKDTCPRHVCCEYAKRINELQVIARKSSMADTLRYMDTYSRSSVASLAPDITSKGVKASNAKRDHLVKQLAKNIMVTASTVLDDQANNGIQKKFSLDYVKKILDWAIWLKAAGLAVSDALQNTPFQKMHTLFYQTFGGTTEFHSQRGLPGRLVSDSKTIDISTVALKDFNPDAVFPTNKFAESQYAMQIENLKVVFEGKHPTGKIKLHPEHATLALGDEVVTTIRGCLGAFMVAHAAAYAFGVSKDMVQTGLIHLIRETFEACLAPVMAPGGKPADGPQQADAATMFLADVRFFCDLQSQEQSLVGTGKVPVTGLHTLLGEPRYALMVFLAALPLIRIGTAFPIFYKLVIYRLKR